MGEIPLMTEQGTFIINGAERVIVSQLHRSPGICFEKKPAPQRRHALLVPHHPRPRLVARGAVRHQRPALRLSRPPPPPPQVPGHHLPARARLRHRRGDPRAVLRDRARSKLDGKDGPSSPASSWRATSSASRTASSTRKRRRPGAPRTCWRGSRRARSRSVTVVPRRHGAITCSSRCSRRTRPTARRRPSRTSTSRLRPGDPPTAANARALLKRLFFDPKRYDLGRVGRYKINQKLGLNGGRTRPAHPDQRGPRRRHRSTSSGSRRAKASLDDIDHLGSRRVRTVGELLANQCRVGLARTERLVRSA